MTGYVYLIHDATNDFYKIGWSKNPAFRLKALQTGSPSALQLIGYISGTREQEQMLHSLLHAHRVRREWFEPCQAISKFVSILHSVAHGCQRTSSHPMLKDFIQEVERYLTKHGMNPTTFGKNFANDPGFVFGLREGREPRFSTIEKVRRRMGAPTQEPAE